ncbi:MAG: DNA polymerase III subunit delta' [Steroidobacter sp.]
MSDTPASLSFAYAMPLPWQQSAWSQLERAWNTDRLPHALLLHGVEGLGKFEFAKWLAYALLCEVNAKRISSRLQPCAHCAGCKLFIAGSHPDFVLITPEEDKQQISVDQIRNASERLYMTSGRQGYRVAIVEPAHQLTVAAANALLKTLEEPGSRTLLILVTSQRGAMLPTIRSRCQQLGITVPSVTMAQNWLQQQIGKTVAKDLLSFANHAPLRVMGYLQGSFESVQRAMGPALSSLTPVADVTQLAQEWADDQLNERLNWLDYWLTQRIRHEILGNDDPVTLNVRQASLQSGGQVLNISALFQALDKLRELKARLRRTALQKELAVESVLLVLQRALSAV